MSIKVGDTMNSILDEDSYFGRKRKSGTYNSYDRYISTCFQSVIALLRIPNFQAKNSYVYSQSVHHLPKNPIYRGSL
jgi:hypothetical protein